jgi:hypothetical protein
MVNIKSVESKHLIIENLKTFCSFKLKKDTAEVYSVNAPLFDFIFIFPSD